MDSAAILIFQLAVLLFSVVIHEVSHGYVAEQLGDPTARLSGRLTLNPLKHLDFFGSFLLPVFLWFLGGIVIGWAKPVPYNPNNLKNPRSGAAKIGAAGPAANLLLAVIFGIILRIMTASGYEPQFLGELFVIIVYLNILLAIFNLVPIPPLDGSKILFALLPSNQASAELVSFLERYGMFILLAFIFFGFSLITPLINTLFFFITGQPFGL